MIIIKEKICDDADYAITHFEPTIRHFTNVILGAHPEKDDCRQELRLKIWKLFKDTERIYNASYISKRVKFDTINFINRDAGFNWNKHFVSLDAFEEYELNELLIKLGNRDPVENLETALEIEDLIVKARPRMSDRQYESLILFMSGAGTELIRNFLGTRSRNMTRYYLLLAEAFTILKEEVDDR